MDTNNMLELQGGQVLKHCQEMHQGWPNFLNLTWSWWMATPHLQSIQRSPGSICQLDELEFRSPHMIMNGLGHKHYYVMLAILFFFIPKSNLAISN